MAYSNNNEKLTIWAAVHPNGTVLKSSVGVFRAATNRWAMKYNGFEVVRLGDIEVPRISVAQHTQKVTQEVKRSAARPTRFVRARKQQNAENRMEEESA